MDSRLTIYNPSECDPSDKRFRFFCHKFVPFLIEKDKWNVTNNLNLAEFIVLVEPSNLRQSDTYELAQFLKDLNLSPDQKIILLDVFNTNELIPEKGRYTFIRECLANEISNKFVIVHSNFGLPIELQHDFFWDRQKKYYTDYDYTQLQHDSYSRGTDFTNFQLTRIEKIGELRKYLSPNTVSTHQLKLKELLQKYDMDGHYSETDANSTWAPISNSLYNSTFFSIYIEAITYSREIINIDTPSNCKAITEKTWDPLIKGHFILPFSYPGIIRDIKSYGFMLPNWIDYSYDNIENNTERFDAFLVSAEKLMKYSIADLMSLYEQDKRILLHNRDLFWKRPYDSLYNKIVEYFKLT